MPYPERTLKHVDTKPRSPTIATMEQFLRGGDSSRMSPTYSPTSPSPSSPFFERMKNHDPEEDQSLYQRKSVLAKVKERARKLVLRNSLSRKRQDDDNITPSWGVSLEDEEGEEEEDAEYLGAPIYESELAPDEYKENARQHPRANPVISEKRVLKIVKPGEQDQENALSPIKSPTTRTTFPQLAPITTNSSNQNMTMTNQKPTLSNVEGSNASSHSAPSKYGVCSITPVAPLSSSMMQNSSSSSSFSSAPSSAKNTISPKSSYPSQALMSPRRSSSNGIGVIEKVKGAVNSFLRNDVQPQQKNVVKNPITHTNSSQRNNTTQEVGQGVENRGRLLQTN
ncbi:hypothetical protein MTR_2g097710 [Medicago truncatula]|uniref:Eukaryotic RNA polymerase II heptapeptide repeat n=1 Tax=Medicago truncatula TaxID=3880 RepID=Q2HS33_MEDTR|nr:Eukaryotic RNA polymerase II heptapeptide repeat [Medicago truncatula]AES67652.2 hypothetical protein MTR_2g097710 [Medicago truncatula]